MWRSMSGRHHWPFFPDNQAEQDRWVRAHLLEILRGKASVVVARAFRRSAHAASHGHCQRQAVDDCTRLPP